MDFASSNGAVECLLSSRRQILEAVPCVQQNPTPCRRGKLPPRPFLELQTFPHFICGNGPSRIPQGRLETLPILPPPQKSSKNNHLYFTQSVRSRLEKCSSCGSVLCVGNSSASRPGEVVLLSSHLEFSPELAVRRCAFLRELNLSVPEAALHVGLS